LGFGESKKDRADSAPERPKKMKTFWNKKNRLFLEACFGIFKVSKN
jgi:hypothetical protein